MYEIPLAECTNTFRLAVRIKSGWLYESFRRKHILHKYQNKNKVILVTNSNKNRAVSTLNYHNLIDKFDDFYFGQILNDEEQINKFEKLILNNRNIIDKFILFENEIEEIQKAILMGIPPKNIIRIKCE